MKDIKELSDKEVSCIRAALAQYLALLQKQIDDGVDDDQRLDLQEDIMTYVKLLYRFEKAEKHSQDFKLVNCGIGIKSNSNKKD